MTLTTGIRLAAYLALAALAGAGCKQTVSYVKAPPSGEPALIKPNLEGAKASTGGASATITPPLATALLVQSLPEPKPPWTESTPVESKLPVPLPDGTRTEVTRVDREYVKSGDAAKNIRLSLTDTRGIPALLLFIQSFEAFQNDGGYRRSIKINDAPAWLTYTYGPNREADGTGSIVFIYRERFLIQIDGGLGVSADELQLLAAALRLDALR